MTSQMQALLKDRYGAFIDPLASEDTIAKFAKFVPPSSRNGRNYKFPVYLGLPHGVTHNDDHTAFSLGSVVAPVTEEASLLGSEILVRDNVAYADMFATGNGVSQGGGEGGAQMSAGDYKVLGLMKSGELYRELALMYGPGSTSTAAVNLGVINASVSGADLNAGQVINITAATWIPGLWPLMTNAIIDIYQTDGTTVRAAGVTVTAPVEATNRITVTKSAEAAVATAGDILLARGAIDVSCYGIEAICANSGSLFGISAASYPQWQVGSHSAGTAPLERRDVLTIGSKAANRGHKTGGTLFVGSHAFDDLAEEANELLQTAPSSNDVVVQGATKLSYRTACGQVDVQSYRFMKQSIGVFMPKGGVKRVGSTDLTFRDPMSKEDWFYTQLGDNAGGQMRIYSDQAVILEQPWLSCYVTAISSTGDTDPA